MLYRAEQVYARIYEFTTTAKPADAQGAAGAYTWTPPANCSLIEFFIVGGGGGGAAGTRQALGVARLGGGAGGAAAITCVTCNRSFFTAPLAITIGVGGAGGAAATADNTTLSSTGVAGTASIISMSGVQILAASGGGGGQAGGSAGLGGSQGTITGNQIGTSLLTAYTTTALSQTGVPPGGGGGSASATNVYTSGQTISPHGIPVFYDRRYQGVLGAAATYTGGGDCAAGVAGGNGANGLFYGSPGSGGGASNNGFASGKGGNGAGGYIRIVCF